MENVLRGLANSEGRGSDVVPSNHLARALHGFASTASTLGKVLTERKLPAFGIPDASIEYLLLQLSLLDTNNNHPPSNANPGSSSNGSWHGFGGAGEREGRIYSSLVARRHFGFSHGIGRSGDVAAPQPKAAGSTALVSCTTGMIKDAIGIAAMSTTTSRACPSGKGQHNNINDKPSDARLPRSSSSPCSSSSSSSSSSSGDSKGNGGEARGDDDRSKGVQPRNNDVDTKKNQEGKHNNTSTNTKNMNSRKSPMSDAVAEVAIIPCATGMTLSLCMTAAAKDRGPGPGEGNFRPKRKGGKKGRKRKNKGKGNNLSSSNNNSSINNSDGDGNCDDGGDDNNNNNENNSNKSNNNNINNNIDADIDDDDNKNKNNVCDNLRYVVMTRVDQKACIKSISHAGFKIHVVDGIVEGDEVRCDPDDVRKALVELGGRSTVVCVLSNSSAFSPRVPDDLSGISRVCADMGVPHIVNNAFGVQSTKALEELREACRVGRVDAFVQSTDKNFMVPVGGAVVACPRSRRSFLASVTQSYPGRASVAPVIDLFITMLSMGRDGWSLLLEERKRIYGVCSGLMRDLADRHGLRVLHTPRNRVSIVLSLVDALPRLTCPATELGSRLFTRGVTGMRVVDGVTEKTIDGHKFTGFGAHTSQYPYAPYIAISCAVGVAEGEIRLAVQKLDDVLSTALTRH